MGIAGMAGMVKTSNISRDINNRDINRDISQSKLRYKDTRDNRDIRDSRDPRDNRDKQKDNRNIDRVIERP